MLEIICFFQNSFWEESWFGFLIAFVILIALILLIFLMFKLTRTLMSRNNDVGSSQKEIDNLNSKIKDLVKENENLKKKLKDKDAQIRRLQRVTIDLSDSNKDLREQSEKLDDSFQESKKLHDKKEELIKMKEDLLGAIVHDIKNPAGIIRGFAELLNSYDLSRAEQEDIIKVIMETSEKMVTLTQEMTKLIIADSDEMILNMEILDINDLVEKIVQSNKCRADEKSISLTMKLPSNLPKIEGDRFRIEEVVDNLIGNAIKYTSLKGKIEVSSEITDKDLIIHVQDSGLGLSQEEVTRVFLPMQRLSARPTGNETSTGIGLSLIKKIIEIHNGKIWVKSKIGVGSTFSFSLPYNSNKK